MIDTATIATPVPVRRYWALLAVAGGYELYTYSATHVLLAQTWLARLDQASAHLPDDVLRLKRAAADHAALVAAWIEPEPAWRPFLLSDPDISLQSRAA